VGVNYLPVLTMGELAFVAALQLLDTLVYQGPAINSDDGLSERCVVEKF
jgi:hypothetical protein